MLGWEILPVQWSSIKGFECFTWKETFAIYSRRPVGSLGEGFKAGEGEHRGYHRKLVHWHVRPLSKVGKHCTPIKDVLILHFEFQWYSCGDKGSWCKSYHYGSDAADRWQLYRDTSMRGPSTAPPSGLSKCCQAVVSSLRATNWCR